MICFKIRIFALRQTSIHWLCNDRAWLWFALKFVSLRLDKHHYRQRSCYKSVVICFKIRIFALRQTSTLRGFTHTQMLWFALKFVSLRLDKHHSFNQSCRCYVVICFKIRIFALRQTSFVHSIHCSFGLWFALKFVSLRLDKHLYSFTFCIFDRCDLL